MEGCAYSLLDCRKTLEEIGVPLPNAYRLIRGGAAGKVWSQIVADVFQCPFQKKGSIDSSCGSAMVAAVGGGFFASFSEAVETDREPWETVWPNPEHKELYKTGFSIYKEIQRVLQPVYHSIAGWQKETE